MRSKNYHFLFRGRFQVESLAWWLPCRRTDNYLYYSHDDSNSAFVKSVIILWPSMRTCGSIKNTLKNVEGKLKVPGTHVTAWSDKFPVHCTSTCTVTLWSNKNATTGATTYHLNAVFRLRVQRVLLLLRLVCESRPFSLILFFRHRLRLVCGRWAQKDAMSFSAFGFDWAWGTYLQSVLIATS
jgi:hypothetical protein